ncbi:GYD domain-containing protein [Natronolimnobius baerhuensis]|uniref:GYD family protein n=1 Tax=Natronolimnobius baerhuensis TaxID=253108 RepID=A0A202E4N3_9EURY|nr:GYD domain-containing protein [Natronolimnobius baerhuensis]OVE83222.1 GYD family protein [Natronolimnobius baerhuensis]
MSTYITLWEFTEQGAATIRDSPDRIDDITEHFEEMGGELREFYMLLGQYDTITISEFPDDETAAQAVLSVTEQGNVTAETSTAFSREETRAIIDGLE